jgi:hypothetical protein
MSDEHKVEKFTGNRSDWKLWSEMFKARLQAKDLWDIVDGDPGQIPDINSDPKDAEEQKYKKQNVKAYSEMMMAMDMKKSQARVAMNLIISSKSKRYPNGNAAAAWQKLCRKYAPNTAAEVSRIKEEYTNAYLKTKADPDAFVDYLERQCARLAEMDIEITNRTFLLDLIGKLTTEYDNIIEKINDILDNNRDISDEMVDQVRDRLRAKYERHIKSTRSNNSQNGNNNKEEGALTASGQFKGRCNRCGKYGHKGFECRTKKKDHIQCYNCKEMGHYQNECPKKHNNNNQGSEAAATAIQEEMVLVSFQKSADETGKPSQHTFLADSGASGHMINDDDGMYDVKPVKINITIGDGKQLTCTKIGNKNYTVKGCGKDEIIVLKDVMFVPGLYVNLFSIGRALQHGC